MPDKQSKVFYSITMLKSIQNNMPPLIKINMLVN